MSFPCRVERPVFAPHRCVVLSKGDDPHGWLDLGNLPTLQPDPRLYLSHGGVLTAARQFGYDIPALLQQTAEIDELRAELDRAMGEIERLEQFQQAVDVIESADFRARRKPGRPKEKAVA